MPKEKRQYRAAYAARDAALIGVLTALLTAVKMALAAIPNIEGVTLLLMVYTITLGWKRATIAALLFSTIEILFYGINTWVLMYYINWPLLVFATHGFSLALRPLYARLAHRPTTPKTKAGRFLSAHALPALCYAGLAGIFGFTFGFLCAIVQAFFYTGSMGYFPYMLAYWAAGIAFDIAHCVGNLLISLVLLTPLCTVFGAVKRGMRLFSHIQ